MTFICKHHSLPVDQFPKLVAASPDESRDFLLVSQKQARLLPVDTQAVRMNKLRQTGLFDWKLQLTDDFVQRLALTLCAIRHVDQILRVQLVAVGNLRFLSVQMAFFFISSSNVEHSSR